LSTDDYAAQYIHFYAVSTRHVVRGRGTTDSPGNPVVRLNKHDGKYDVIPLTHEDWIVSDEHDIAVAPISHNPAHRYLFVSVVSRFLTKEIAKQKDVGIGDEVFMVGRLIHHDGRQKNTPSLRWGHVSMMPFEPVYHEHNSSREQESFLVEVHSIGGFSGSPVFVRPFPTEKLLAGLPVSDQPPSPGQPPPDLKMFDYYQRRYSGPWLLGVEWGVILDSRCDNTGMSGVVPAWHVTDLLNDERLKTQRAQEQNERLERRQKGGTTLTSRDEPDFTKWAFAKAVPGRFHAALSRRNISRIIARRIHASLTRGDRS
jgi:hypothetical protein